MTRTHGLASLLFVFVLPGFAQAQTCPGTLPAGIQCVLPNTPTDITAFTICAKITNANTSGKALMVPTGTTNEWLEFRTKPGAGVTVAACAATCSGYTIGASCVGDAVYAGDISGVKYMVTKGGCTNSATPTCAGGTDGVTKAWGASTYGINTGAVSTTDGTANTTTLAAGWSDTYAAKFCQDMVFEGFTDWFLPARTELTLLYTNRVAIGGFAAASYLTSTDAAPPAPNFAWRIDFTTGSNGNWNKTLTTAYVRCVRKI